MTDQHAGGWPDETRPGVPANPERNGWHWLAREGCKPEPAEYRILGDGDGYFWWNGSFLPPERVAQLAARGLHYLGPCLTPAEVAAQVAAAREAGRREGIEAAAALIDRDAEDAEKRWEAISDSFGIGSRFVSTLRQYATAIRALLEPGR